MKKFILSVIAIAMVFGTTFLNSCKKDDIAPVISLVGDAAPAPINLGTTYTDPGATATDNKDSKVTVTKTGTVNTNQVGEYVLRYNAADAAGNKATEVTRTVKVRSGLLAGTYSVVSVVVGTIQGTTVDTTINISNVTVSQADPQYNRILISNFDGDDDSFYATINGSVITIPSQTPIGYEDEGMSVTISGSGQYNGAQFKITNINYTLVFAGGDADENGTYTCTETYTKH